MIASLMAVLFVGAPIQEVQLKKASHHPMKYYVSLPEGWSAKRKWPVVVAIEGAERDFEGAAYRFAKARKHMPFIIVVPMVVTNGGPGYRTVPSYRYSEETWNEIGRIGEYNLDLDGIAAVVTDVKQLYSGEQKFYITGFEAGCHTLFAVTFRHPEWLYASVPNSPNFQGRGLEESSFSKSTSRENLPIHEIHGSEDGFAAPGRPFFAQWKSAESAAKAHGFKNITNQVVPGKGHVWVVGEVLAYFNRLEKKR